MEGYKFVQNKNCEYFPCHKGVPEDEFNCLFCYCPLYALKEECGGNYVYLKNGVKSCQACTKPHDKESYDHIMAKMDKIIELGKKEKQNRD